ncbi:unnamed protein product [Choristocarpus tenellus]
MILVACFSLVGGCPRPFFVITKRACINTQGPPGLLNELKEGLKTIRAIRDEWDIEVRRVTKGMGSIAAMELGVKSSYAHRAAAPPGSSNEFNDAAPNVPDTGHSHSHSHDSHGSNHSHGHNHGRSHSRSHSHNHSHQGGNVEDATSAAGEHDHVHQHTGQDQDHGHDPLRNVEVIASMLRDSDLPEAVKDKSIAVFNALGEAEAKTHGTTLDQVHFHEVGAIDSIVDTVGVVYALHLLGIEKLYCSALPFSEGTVWTAHGILPVPAPATLHLLVGIPTCPGPKSATGELVTPTGAALVKVLTSEFGRPPPFSPEAIGIGAGTKDFKKHPNILRVICGNKLPQQQGQAMAVLSKTNAGRGTAVEWVTDSLCVLEANIDDMTGEVAGYVTERLLNEGSLDAWVSPIFMKKGRPAFTVHALCETQDQEQVMRVLFKESTTLGVRRRLLERCSLRREIVTVNIPSLGDVRVKTAWLDGVPVNTKPEFEDCKLLAIANDVPIREVMEQAKAAAHTRSLSAESGIPLQVNTNIA